MTLPKVRTMLWIVLAIVGGVIVLLLIGVASQVDDWGRDLTTNHATTSEAADDPLLRPLHTQLSPEETVQAVRAAVAEMNHWDEVDKQPPADGARILHLIRSTGLWRFKDDVTVRVEPDGSRAGAVIHVKSQSRVGKGDLGQNPRNIKELLRSVQEHLAAGQAR